MVGAERKQLAHSLSLTETQVRGGGDGCGWDGAKAPWGTSGTAPGPDPDGFPVLCSGPAEWLRRVGGGGRCLSAPALETPFWFGLDWFGLFLCGWRDPHKYSRARGKAREANSGGEEKNKKQAQVWIRGQKGSVCWWGDSLIPNPASVAAAKRRTGSGGHETSK